MFQPLSTLRERSLIVMYHHPRETLVSPLSPAHLDPLLSSPNKLRESRCAFDGIRIVGKRSSRSGLQKTATEMVA
jgi:hypothetical protein